MANLSATRCCGVLEIDGICYHETPGGVLDSIAHYFKEGKIQRVPFITFTGVTWKDPADRAHAGSNRKDNYGQALADHIAQNDLGRVIGSNERMSWSKNVIKIWVWELNWPAIETYYDLKR